ncbi:UDP-N-acetylenolpyruvoylglucosamine reductase [hydrothermal vent metagenome]|uniref:UDP-N-acetylmuramate dehydrogenase n=1 Tax=hydrothermal vent metagenome TaxID=652676 RepID=A0A1W1CC38_9ZZZZ
MQTKSINFSKYSSFKIGGTFDVALLDTHATTEGIKGYTLIGACNNVLIGNNPPPLMMLSKEFDYIKVENDLLKIGAATPSGKIASYCKKHNIANFEFLSHLPGKLGGLVYMNAGLKEYEIFNHLINLTTLSGKKAKEDINYGYRCTDINEPILEASFALKYGYSSEKVAMFKTMRANQPSTPSAGSCFKNPEGDYAGRLIEAVGLKGKMQGSMCFSQEHANFLVNNGGGSYEDAVFLIDEAQKRVYEQFGILLELEIAILDKDFKPFQPE